MCSPNRCVKVKAAPEDELTDSRTGEGNRRFSDDRGSIAGGGSRASYVPVRAKLGCVRRPLAVAYPRRRADGQPAPGGGGSAWSPRVAHRRADHVDLPAVSISTSPVGRRVRQEELELVARAAAPARSRTPPRWSRQSARGSEGSGRAGRDIWPVSRTASMSKLRLDVAEGASGLRRAGVRRMWMRLWRRASTRPGWRVAS